MNERMALHAAASQSLAMLSVPTFELPLVSSRGLLLCNLQLPWQAGIEVTAGHLTLMTQQGLPQNLRAGSCAFVPAHTRFDLLLLPPSGSALAARCRIVTNPGRADHWRGRTPLAHAAARCVFDAPDAPWSIALLAQRLGVGAVELRRRLFAENASARSIIRSQRLVRALALTLTTPWSTARIAQQCGWANAATLQRAFRETLMLDTSALERNAKACSTAIAQAANHWPALDSIAS